MVTVQPWRINARWLYYEDQMQADRTWLGGLSPDAAPKIAWDMGATLFAL